MARVCTLCDAWGQPKQRELDDARRVPGPLIFGHITTLRRQGRLIDTTATFADRVSPDDPMPAPAARISSRTSAAHGLGRG